MRKPTLFALAAACNCALAADINLSYLGQQTVPTGTLFAGTSVGGLSALDYDAANQRYFALSDDRSGINPARFYTLSLDLGQFTRAAAPGMAGVSFTGVTTLQQPGGGAFATNAVDPEGLRLDPARGTLYWSNEGQRSPGFLNPTVREMNLDGTHARDFAVPTYYNPSGSSLGLSAGDQGVYDNLAFESVALSTDGNTLYVATENGLTQNGLPATILSGSRSRILAFDIATGLPSAEYIHDIAPVPVLPRPITALATNGLSDMVAIGDLEFIAIERSFSSGVAVPGTSTTGYTIRLHHLDATSATNVAGLSSLSGLAITPVAKTLLLDLATLKNDDGSPLALDNIEGLTLGPVVDGKQTLILVSDNNFSASQSTQFVALQISPVPEPETYAQLLAGLGLLGWLARRRG